MRLSEREKYFLLNNLCKIKFLPVLEKTRAIIAGGAIRSVFTNTPIRDYDIYFKSANDRDLAISYLKNQDNGFEKIFETETALTYKKEDIIIQIIQRDRFLVKKAEDLIDTFDFTICMGAYDIAEDRLVLGEDFLKHNAQRRLVFNPNAKYPICSLFRAKKYVKKYGYNISGIELVKIGLCINKLDLNNYADLKEQLLGIDTLFLKELTDKLGSQELAYQHYEFDEFMHMLEEHLSRYYNLLEAN